MNVANTGKEDDKILLEYKEYLNKKYIFGISAFIFLILLSFYSISVGSFDLPLKEVISVLIGRDLGMANTIVWNIRFPQVLTAIVAGAGLAVSGAIMQIILKNPLGSPFTLGISQAAGFGAAFSIVVLGMGAFHSGTDGEIVINNPYITTISAFFWALISTFIILLLIKFKNAATETMILTGVALGSLFQAGTTAIQYFADDVEIASIVFWTFGDVARATWTDLLLIIAVLVPAVVYFIKNSWNYNAICSGDETARALGVDVDKLRIKGMLISSLITAMIVSFVGIIGFVGLVAPHIVRKLIGTEERYLIPFSCLAGAILLLAADTAARTIISPVVLPVGILTSFLGVPLFIYLILKGENYIWN
ncbi:MAG: FecCD family ABC transporter permease [Halanaerobiaceae bacterium]